MPDLEIVFETHSISTDNELGIATGWLPGQLSPAGREAARQLGARYRDTPIVAVYASDLARSVETAEIAFGMSGVPIRTDQRLRECNYGQLNGMPRARVDAERIQRIERAFPDGESYAEVVERVREFLSDIARVHEGERIVVIGHSATHWALEHLLLRKPLAQLVRAPPPWQPGWRYVLSTPAAAGP